MPVALVVTDSLSVECRWLEADVTVDILIVGLVVVMSSSLATEQYGTVKLLWFSSQSVGLMRMRRHCQQYGYVGRCMQSS